MRIPTIVALLVGLAALAAAQDRLADQLRKGIVQEEANGSPDKAIPIYQGIVAQFDQDRQAAATALFRLGECYRKAGKREQAVAAYRRVVREFGEQAALVEPSRMQLQAYGVAESATARESAEVAQLKQQVAEFRRAEEAARASWTPKRVMVPPGSEASADTVVGLLKLRISSLERQIAEAKSRVQVGVTPQSELQSLMDQYQAVVLEYQAQVKDRERNEKLTQETIKSLEAEIVLVQQQVAELEKKYSPGHPDVVVAKRELLALQRTLAEVRAGAAR
jgi:tetratricopeptide (TPR) repeat protein